LWGKKEKKKKKFIVSIVSFSSSSPSPSPTTTTTTAAAAAVAVALATATAVTNRMAVSVFGPHSVLSLLLLFLLFSPDVRAQRGAFWIEPTLIGLKDPAQPGYYFELHYK